MAIHSTADEEHALVREFFGGETSGYFVEVGTNHPAEGSQTWHLEQAGWTGVLVEPQPELAAFLVTSRKARVFANACSSPENAGQSLPLRVDEPSSAFARDRRSPGAQASYVIVVPTRTLDSILEEAEALAPIDLLSIDVGGYETEVLRGFDFNRWQPLLILLEDRDGSLQTHRYLKKNGYSLVRRLGDTGWYVPAGEPMTISSSERWGILCKYYLALPFRVLRNAWNRVRRLYADWWAGR